MRARAHTWPRKQVAYGDQRHSSLYQIKNGGRHSFMHGTDQQLDSTRYCGPAVSTYNLQTYSEQRWLKVRVVSCNKISLGSKKGVGTHKKKEKGCGGEVGCLWWNPSTQVQILDSMGVIFF